ncbi:DUF4430 domain-containing protein [Enterococcus sp. DIV0876]|uniref:DUF4430 domain-containing protein n=1 Tax=Enterococcus sp. DIV0876 TaxID=2774633 RepID=UPI003D2FE19D
MKKLTVLSTIIIGLFVLSGCQTDQVSSQASTEATSEVVASSVKIVLTDGDDTIDSKTVSYQSGETLMDVLTDNFDIEEKDGFITSIEGHAQDESQNKYWTFTINGEMGAKGADETTLESGDQVDFALSVYE